MRDLHQQPAPVDGGITRLCGPAERLDDCPDCGGSVQRLARHSQGLGELWAAPLTVNVAENPMSPRLRGPGFFTIAMDCAARVRQEAQR